MSQPQTMLDDSILDKGSEILFEKVAEAFEPEWRLLLERIYRAMRRADD
jgi:hypothetical protein